MPVLLSTNLDDPVSIPYFLWDEPISVAELHHRLETGSREEHLRLLGKILREARDTDVWVFTTPREVQELWQEILLHLGHRRPFWEFLFARWKAEGLLGE